MRLAQKTTLGTSQTTKTKKYDNKTKTRWMVSNITDSGVDFAYDMPESIVAALGSQGFAEAARAFQSIAGDEVPAAMRSQISLVIPQAERVVTTDDVQKEIDEFILRVGASSGSLVDQARAMLTGLVGKPYSSLTGMASALERLTSLAQSANSLSDPETPEARLLAIQNQINDIYENQRRLLDQALQEGRITQDQHDRAYAAIGEAQQANATYGAGSEQAQAANAKAESIISPIAEGMNRSEAGSGDALQSNQADIRSLDSEARGIQSVRAAERAASTENRNSLAADSYLPANNSNINDYDGRQANNIISTGGMFASAANANVSNAPVQANESAQTRLAYAEASEGQFVPLQPTPAAVVNSGNQIIGL